MSKSRSYDLIMHLYAPVWEAHRLYEGRRYRSTGRDLAEAKKFLEGNPDFLLETDAVVEFQQHAMIYLDASGDWWSQRAAEENHPAHIFLSRYNTYNPPRNKEERPQVHRFLCPDCLAKHRSTIISENEMCPVCHKEEV